MHENAAPRIIILPRRGSAGICPKVAPIHQKNYIVSSKPGIGHSHWLTHFKPKTECLTFDEEFLEGFDMNLP